MRVDARVAPHAISVMWLVVALLTARLALQASNAATRQTNGFGGYYSAARLVAHGADISRLYDDVWFGNQMQVIGLHVADIYRPNPPTLALLLAPFGLFNHDTSRILWILMSLLCLALAIGLLAHTSHIALPVVAALALVLHPVAANIEQGQIYLLLLALLTLAWYGYHHARAKALGAGMTLLLLMKTAVPLLWPLLALQRRWRALVWSGAATLTLVLATLPWAGIDAWRAYIPTVSHLGSGPEFAVTAYQSQSSLVRHLLTQDPRWNPAPLTDAPTLATLLVWGSLALMLALTLAVFVTRRHDDLAFASIVALSLIASPVSAEYHFVLLMVPLVILIGWARSHATVVEWFVLAMTIVLVGADLPYGSSRFTDGSAALLAYPRLYGTWLIWGLSLYAACRAAPERGYG
jgi:hypothetical protein